jgi:predicted phosphodiesterase
MHWIQFGHFHGIWGNHDRLLEMRRRLKRMEVLEIAGKRLGLVHGTFYPVGRQRRLKAWFKKEKIDILLFGHSHVVTTKTLDGVFLFNPGSVTGKFPATHGSFGLLTLNGTIESQVIAVQYQTPVLRRAILNVPSWIIRQGTAFLESWPYCNLSRFWDTFRSLLRLASQNQERH